MAAFETPLLWEISPNVNWAPDPAVTCTRIIAELDKRLDTGIEDPLQLHKEANDRRPFRAKVIGILERQDPLERWESPVGGLAIKLEQALAQETEEIKRRIATRATMELSQAPRKKHANRKAVEAHGQWMSLIDSFDKLGVSTTANTDGQASSTSENAPASATPCMDEIFPDCSLESLDPIKVRERLYQALRPMRSFAFASRWKEHFRHEICKVLDDKLVASQDRCQKLEDILYEAKAVMAQSIRGVVVNIGNSRRENQSQPKKAVTNKSKSDISKKSGRGGVDKSNTDISPKARRAAGDTRSRGISKKKTRKSRPERAIRLAREREGLAARTGDGAAPSMLLRSRGRAPSVDDTDDRVLESAAMDIE